jgi:hypothetical protein
MPFFLPLSARPHLPPSANPNPQPRCPQPHHSQPHCQQQPMIQLILQQLIHCVDCQLFTGFAEVGGGAGVGGVAGERVGVGGVVEMGLGEFDFERRGSYCVDNKVQFGDC